MAENTSAHRDNIQKLIQYLRDIHRTMIGDIVGSEGGPTIRAPRCGGRGTRNFYHPPLT